MSYVSEMIQISHLYVINWSLWVCKLIKVFPAAYVTACTTSSAWFLLESDHTLLFLLSNHTIALS